MNKHDKLLFICKVIGIDFSSLGYDILTNEDGTKQYAIRVSGGYWYNRSPNEIIFKPNFIQTLRNWLTIHYSEVATNEILYGLLMSGCVSPEKYIYNFINNETRSN